MRQKDDFYSQLKGLVLPITIQSFMLALVSATDAIMLGLVDQTSLSSVSLAGQVQFVFSLFIAGITAGVGIMTAQYWGKGDVSAVERVVPIALRVNLLGGGLFTLAAALAPRFLMRIFTDEAPLILHGGEYLRAVALSYLLCGISQAYLTLLKNTGRAAASSRISSAAVGLNIVLNAILIFGLFGTPALGIVGAAHATVAARAVELVWSVLETARPGRVKVRWEWLFRPAGQPLFGDFWKYTFPVLGAAMVWGIAFTLYSVILGHMGNDAVAANSIASIAKSLLSCLAKGLSGGAGVLVGNLLGAREFGRAKEYGGRLTRLSIAVGGLTGGLLILCSPLIIRIAPLSETATGYLQWMLVICGINVMGQSANMTVLDGIFCAGGDSKFDMQGNLFAMWGFSVPLGFLAAFWLKLPVLAVYVIISLDEIVKLPAVYHHYKKYIWLRDITRDAVPEG